MWYLIKYEKRFQLWLLFEGTENGYKFTKAWEYRLTAQVYAKIHRIKFIND